MRWQLPTVLCRKPQVEQAKDPVIPLALHPTPLSVNPEGQELGVQEPKAPPESIEFQAQVGLTEVSAPDPII